MDKILSLSSNQVDSNFSVVSLVIVIYIRSLVLENNKES